MAISPLEMNGMYSRTQDFTSYKQNEDNRAMVGQAVIQTQQEKEEELHATQVEQTNQSDTHQKRQDARDKGKNEYMGDGGKKRKVVSPHNQDGTFQKKTASHFDMSI